MEDLGSGDGEGEDVDVVLLTEGLRPASNLVGRLRRDPLGAIEAEKFALRVLGLDDTIGEERDAVAGHKRESCFCVFAVGCDAKGQTGFKPDQGRGEGLSLAPWSTP
jgi:hypothetical protein